MWVTVIYNNFIKYLQIYKLIGDIKMAIKVGISGFGRIGRVVIRAAMDMPEIEIVTEDEINALFTS